MSYKQFTKKALAILSIILLSSITGFAQNQTYWSNVLKEQLSLMGHRNWVLIVDAAYPLQASLNIKTICSNKPIQKVTKTVLKIIDQQPHIKPIILQDKEFSFMDDNLKEGTNTLKAELNQLLKPYNSKQIMHEDIFKKIDNASKLFNILIIKTNCTIPYSSIFIELDCGYWDTTLEKKLREKMNE